MELRNILRRRTHGVGIIRLICGTQQRRSGLPTSRCVVESNPTALAVVSAQAQRWQTSFARPCLLSRNPLRASQWHTLGDAAAGTGLRLGHDLLTAVMCFGKGGHLANDPLRRAGAARSQAGWFCAA